MSIYKQNATNADAEVHGAWFDFGTNEDGSLQRFKLARMATSNVKYAAAIRKITTKYKKALELNTLSDELAEKVFREAFVDTVLVGWEGISDEKGKTLPFNRDNALKLLTDLPDVYSALQEFAKAAANYRAASLDEDAGN